MLELSIGQFSSSGCVKIWDLAPGFRGIGYGQSLATFIVCSYYCVLIGTSYSYLFASFQSVLPWTVCHPDLAEAGTICLPSSSNRFEFEFIILFLKYHNCTKILSLFFFLKFDYLIFINNIFTFLYLIINNPYLDLS